MAVPSYFTLLNSPSSIRFHTGCSNMAVKYRVGGFLHRSIQESDYSK